jgi:hypothetical protein
MADQGWPVRSFVSRPWVRKQRKTLVYMTRRAVRTVSAATNAAASALGAAAIELTDRLLPIADALLTWQRRRQHALDQDGIIYTDGAIPYTLDEGGRRYNMQLQHAEGVRQHGWVAAVRAGPHDAGAVAPVAASADASSDEVLPELDAAAARVVAPASGTWHLHWVGISTAVPAVAAACAAAFAAAVAPWHYDGNVAASASAIEAAVSADAEALVARTPIVFSQCDHHQCTYRDRYRRHRRSWSPRSMETQGEERQRQEDSRCATVTQLDQLAPSHLIPPDRPRCSSCKIDTRRRHSSMLTGHSPKTY